MQPKDLTTLTLEEPASSVGVSPTVFIPQWSQNPYNKIFYVTSGSSGSSTNIPFREKQKEFSKPNFFQGTVGENEFIIFTSILIRPDVTKPARETISNLSNHVISDVADRLLIIIRDQIDMLEYFDKLPSIRAVEREDNSLLIEWIFDNFRIGFSIEQKVQESGWYLVTGDKLGNIFAYGGLISENLSKLIAWLLNFVEKNYI